jgi:hypothetical protein
MQTLELGLTLEASGKAKGWGTAIECQDSACQGIVNAHSTFTMRELESETKCTEYTNTTIRLASRDMSFAKTAALDRVDATPLRTIDNGLTWKIDTINVRQTRF